MSSENLGDLKNMAIKDIIATYGSDQEKMRQLLANESFFNAFLNLQLQEGRFEYVIQLLKNTEVTDSSGSRELLKLWDEAMYRKYGGGKAQLSALQKFKIRKRNHPPASICPGGKRPTSVISKESRVVLMAWLDSHRSYPYPNREIKQELAAKAGLTYYQVNVWFGNARRSIRKKLRLQTGQQVKQIQETTVSSCKVESSETQPVVAATEESSDDKLTETGLADNQLIVKENTEPSIVPNSGEQLPGNSMDEYKGTEVKQAEYYWSEIKSCFDDTVKLEEGSGVSGHSNEYTDDKGQVLGCYGKSLAFKQNSKMTKFQNDIAEPKAEVNNGMDDKGQVVDWHEKPLPTFKENSQMTMIHKSSVKEGNLEVANDMNVSHRSDYVAGRSNMILDSKGHSVAPCYGQQLACYQNTGDITKLPSDSVSGSSKEASHMSYMVLESSVAERKSVLPKITDKTFSKDRPDHCNINIPKTQDAFSMSRSVRQYSNECTLSRLNTHVYNFPATVTSPKLKESLFSTAQTQHRDQFCFCDRCHLYLTDTQGIVQDADLQTNVQRSPLEKGVELMTAVRRTPFAYKLPENISKEHRLSLKPFGNLTIQGRQGKENIDARNFRGSLSQGQAELSDAGFVDTAHTYTKQKTVANKKPKAEKRSVVKYKPKSVKQKTYYFDNRKVIGDFMKQLKEKILARQSERPSTELFADSDGHVIKSSVRALQLLCDKESTGVAPRESVAFMENLASFSNNCYKPANICYKSDLNENDVKIGGNWNENETFRRSEAFPNPFYHTDNARSSEPLTLNFDQGQFDSVTRTGTPGYSNAVQSGNVERCDMVHWGIMGGVSENYWNQQEQSRRAEYCRQDWILNQPMNLSRKIHTTLPAHTSVGGILSSSPCQTLQGGLPLYSFGSSETSPWQPSYPEESLSNSQRTYAYGTSEALKGEENPNDYCLSENTAQCRYGTVLGEAVQGLLALSS